MKNLNTNLRQNNNQSPVDVGPVVYQQKRYSMTTYSTNENPYVKKIFISSLSIAVLTVLSLTLVPVLRTTNSSSKKYWEQESTTAFNTIGTVQSQDLLDTSDILKKPMDRQLAVEIKAEIEKARIAAEKILVTEKTNNFYDIYLQAEKKYGVPSQILAAVHYVETRQSGDTKIESTAGALGPMQFMPNTFNAYAQDGDGDGVKSIFNVSDAIFSAANNLAANGATKGKMYEALFNYNHSDEYVKKVLEIAKGFGYKEELIK